MYNRSLLLLKCYQEDFSVPIGVWGWGCLQYLSCLDGLHTLVDLAGGSFSPIIQCLNPALNGRDGVDKALVV